MNGRRNVASIERQQRKLDAGLVEAQFPEVTVIVISMIYNQRDIQKSLPRVIDFYPGSYALFRIDCLNKDCVDGGLDLTQVIAGMIKKTPERRQWEILAAKAIALTQTIRLLPIKLPYNTYKESSPAQKMGTEGNPRSLHAASCLSS